MVRRILGEMVCGRETCDSTADYGDGVFLFIIIVVMVIAGRGSRGEVASSGAEEARWWWFGAGAAWAWALGPEVFNGAGGGTSRAHCN